MPTIDLGYVIGPQGPQGNPGATGATGSQGNPGPNQVTGSTSTPLNGVLQGNGSKISAAGEDLFPRNGSANIVRSAAVYDAVHEKPNPNLLINAYFVGGGTGRGVFPVNQRGKSQYDEKGPTIDSWENNNASTAIALANDYVRVSGSSGTFLQRTPISAAAMVGNTITCSAIARGSFRFNISIGTTHRSSYFTTEDLQWEIISWTYTFDEVPSNDYFAFWLNTDSAQTYGYADIVALKVEYGRMETLGFLKNGVIYVEEPTSYDYELVKSQLNSKAGLYAAQPSGSGDPLAGVGMATLAMIARAEYGAKPSGSSIASGKLFCWRGQLYKATATITTSTNITPGSNCTQTTLAAELNM